MDLLGTVLFVALKKEAVLFAHHALTLTVFGTAALTGFGHHYCLFRTMQQFGRGGCALTLVGPFDC